MTWWKKKPAPPAIPPYPTQVEVKTQHAPKEPVMEVEENLDPSDSMIIRFVKKLKGDPP